VDTNGSLLKIVVYTAGLSESEGGCRLLQGLAPGFPRLRHLWTDQGYKPLFVTGVGRWRWLSLPIRHAVTPLRRCVNSWASKNLPDVTRAAPRRWVVERPFAWFGNQRRLSKAYELLPRTTETWAYLTMGRLLVRRLAAANA